MQRTTCLKASLLHRQVSTVNPAVCCLLPTGPHAQQLLPFAWWLSASPFALCCMPIAWRLVLCFLSIGHHLLPLAVQTQVILGIDLWASQPKAWLHAVCLPIHQTLPRIHAERVRSSVNHNLFSQHIFLGRNLPLLLCRRHRSRESLPSWHRLSQVSPPKRTEAARPSTSLHLQGQQKMEPMPPRA